MNDMLTRRAFAGGAAVAGIAGSAAVVGLGAAGREAVAEETDSASEGQQLPVGVATTTADWLQRPEEIPRDQIAETVDCDIVVVGCGVGGVTASLTSVEEGASTVLLEKTSGLAVGSHWIGGIGGQLYLEAGVTYDRDAIVNDLMWHANYRADQRLIQLWYDNSGEAIDWYRGRCESDGTMNVMIETDIKDTNGAHMSIPEAYVPVLGEITEMGPNETGLNYSNKILLDMAIEQGLKYYDYTEALYLLQDTDGAVTGLVARRDDGTYAQFNTSKGVILCTGGYIANDEMRKNLNPYQERTTMAATPVAPNCTGDGIKMGLWAGAAMSDLHWWMDTERGILEGGNWRPGSQPWLKLDCYGNRFMNEDTQYDFGAYAGSLCPDARWWNVFDDNFWADLESFHTTICSRMYPWPGAINSELVMHSKEEFAETYIDPYIKRGCMLKADTLEDLCAQMQEYDGGRMDLQTLEASIERYNELCASGHDDDFGKMATRMMPVDTAPYYAIMVTGSAICNLDGLRINENVEVIDAAGKPIPGLYAAGNDQGGFYGMSYPWYYAGLNCGRTVTFARLAAKHAAHR